MRRLFGPTIALSFLFDSAAADVTKSGPEFTVNAVTSLTQREQQVASMSDGTFVVVWTSSDATFNSNIYARRVGTGSATIGDEIRVNTATSNAQGRAQVAADGQGNFVVVWGSQVQDGSGYGVFGQRFSYIASPVGTEFRINTYTTGDQRRANAAAWPDGRFIVVWESVGQDGDQGGIFGQRFGADGAPVDTELQVNTYTTKTQYAPDVAVLAEGFVVAWTGNGQDAPASATDGGNFGQRFDDSGARAGSEFQVNSYTTGDQREVAIAPRSDGGFVIVWEDYEQDPNGHGVFAQRYQSSGARLGTEFQLDTVDSGDQDRPDVAPLPDGGFFAAWQDEAADGSGDGVFGAAFAANGAATGSELRLSTTTQGDQADPALAAYPDGQMLAVWRSEVGSDPGNVFAQRFDSGGAIGGTCGDPAGLVYVPSRRRARHASSDAARVVTASDALAVLRTAVGSQTCELCVCDVDSSGAITASDALVTLKAAVGQAVSLNCPAC